MKNSKGVPYNFFRLISYYYPLTFSGSLLFLISVYLLIFSFYTNNPYSFLISIVSLFILILLSFIGRIQANQGIQVDWDSTIPLYADQNNKFVVYINKFKRFLFYRIHFKVKGSVKIGKNANIRIHEEVSSDGQDEIEVSCFFPVCGTFFAKGTLFVKDIFNLTKARFQKEQEQVLKIRPAIVSGIKINNIKAMEGFENTAKQKQADEEKYYQREYMPGDRFRDINWKATSRISKLITKISHITQEKTKTILILFRNFKRDPEKSTRDSIVHLNFLKSWLMTFLKSVKEENNNYIFNIISGSGSVTLESMEEIELFSAELGSIFFRTDSMSFANIKVPSEVFVFTTCYDININSVFTFFSDSKINIFRTVQKGINNKEEYKYRYFKSLESFYLPGKWIFLKDNLKNNLLRAGSITDRTVKTSIF